MPRSSSCPRDRESVQPAASAQPVSRHAHPPPLRRPQASRRLALRAPLLPEPLLRVSAQPVPPLRRLALPRSDLERLGSFRRPSIPSLSALQLPLGVLSGSCPAD